VTIKDSWEQNTSETENYKEVEQLVLNPSPWGESFWRKSFSEGGRSGSHELFSPVRGMRKGRTNEVEKRSKDVPTKCLKEKRQGGSKKKSSVFQKSSIKKKRRRVASRASRG